MARSFPGPPQQWSDGVTRRERAEDKEPAANTEQRAARQRLATGAAAGENCSQSHHASTSECQHQSCLARDLWTALDDAMDSAGERGRSKSTDGDSEELDHQPVDASAAIRTQIAREIVTRLR